MDLAEPMEAMGTSAQGRTMPDSTTDTFDHILYGGEVETQYDEWRSRLDRSAVPPTAVLAARDLDDSTKRRRATPVRKSFVRCDDGTVPPMAQVYCGGRSGIVALKLYLALIWRCSHPPYRTDKPNRSWATLLGLEDPEGRGVRRIAAALKTLAKHHLIQITPQPGQPNLVTLLDESGDGSPYAPPSTEYTRAGTGPENKDVRDRNVYFRVPSKLWVEGDIQLLTGPGLVFLLILLAEQAGDGVEVWFSTNRFPTRYHVSPTTRASGTKELRKLHLLQVTPQALTTNPGGSVFDRRRIRNLYRLKGPALAPVASPPATVRKSKRKARRKAATGSRAASSPQEQ